MSAFGTVTIPGGFRVSESDEALPGPPRWPGNYWVENSNRALVYPWGRPSRNAFFIGPQEHAHLALPVTC